MLNIVLHEPEIPANTGNIGRTCVAAGARLHLIEPLGFQINEKQLKRAGLDYWHLVDVRVYEDLDEFFAKNQPGCDNICELRGFPCKESRSKDIHGDNQSQEEVYRCEV